MKRVKLIFTLVLLLSFSFSQAQDLKGFSQEESIAFFGVDYSQTLFVGTDGFTDVEMIATYYPATWNSLFVEESKKYSIKKTLDKELVHYSLKTVDSINGKITKNDVELRLGNSLEGDKLLNIDKAKKTALTYSLKSTNYKYGAIVFATEYNKLIKRGSYIIVVLNLEKNIVVFTKQFEGKAKGFGFRNYWAGSYYDGLSSLAKVYKKELKNL
ncbi:MAG: hypothetical protein IZT56_05770 [Bacteroidetes bacterium]|nr:hypothetical protein [Bacteroidota bacterium]